MLPGFADNMLRILLLLLMVFGGLSQAVASITISGTRVIFPGSEREVSVRTNNKGNRPALAQVWIDDGSVDANINNVKTPFIVTPPVYRVEPGKGQTVRVIYNGMSLPQDRESVFWFNMLEIPPQNKNHSSGQKLELAFRTRIKVFYRPQSLEKNNSSNEVDQLKWEMVTEGARGKGIKVTNNSPYYFSFGPISVTSQGRSVELDSDMVAPKSSATFYPRNKLKMDGKFSSLDFQVVNDYGAYIKRTLTWNDSQGFVIKNK